MRGKVIDTLSGKFVIRITPAYAGKRQIWTWESWGSGDHPRLCGEKLKTADTLKWLPRITPAYAGKRYSFEPATRPKRDHPRLCGEKS